MTKRLRVACFLTLATLTSCRGNADTPATDDPTARAAQSVTLSTDTAGLVQTTTTKGTTVQLDGRFQNAVVAHRAADGTITTECHDDQQAAESFMQGTSASAAKVELQ